MSAVGQRLQASVPYYEAIRALSNLPAPTSHEQRKGVLDALVGYSVPVVNTLHNLPRTEYDPIFFQSLTDEIEELILRRVQEHAARQPQTKTPQRASSSLARFFPN